MRKIYIATSWKMENAAIVLANRLRDDGHEVDCFCDSTSGRYVFHWSEFVEKQEDLKNYDAMSFIADERVKRAFNEDKKWLDWADTVILLLPSGKSAHLEAGYAVGQGKSLYIMGGFQKGEFDVMYGFARGMYKYEELHRLRERLKEAA
jgi:hypothetical protein